MTRRIQFLTLSLASAAAYSLPLPALAETSPLVGPPDPWRTEQSLSEPSQNATINLIRLLVQRGVLTQEDAVGLIRQAEREAAVARAQSEAVQAAAAEIRAAAEADAQWDEDDLRVTYVPEHVRQEIAEDVRHDILTRHADRLAGSGESVPRWVSRFRPFGDLRLRFEATRYPSDNLNTGAFPDFNAINTGLPFDVTGTVFAPQWNTDRDRNRTRLRLRLGFEVDLEQGFVVGTRIATGQGTNPVSTNQTMGAPGNFSRYAIWLDRAFLRWDRPDSEADLQISISGGRFANPFQSTEIVWDADLGFDGLALSLRRDLGARFTAFGSAGVFPIFNTGPNFPSNQPSKFKSDDRYLTGLQAGLEFTPNRDIELSLALAYYHFGDIQGELSSPFVPLSTSDFGDTDTRRPPFAQKGNTYMALRDIVPVPANNFGTEMQWQYFGLVTPFRVLAATGRLDLNHFETVRISLFGELAKNTAFDGARAEAFAVNNRGPDTEDGEPGTHAGGDLAWILGLSVGRPLLAERGDWNLGLDYRYVESDAVVDGFTESTFGLGGTNVKGFTLRGAYSIHPAITLGFRWMSASQVAGPTFKSDIFQFDLSTRF